MKMTNLERIKLAMEASIRLNKLVHKRLNKPMKPTTNTINRLALRNAAKSMRHLRLLWVESLNKEKENE